MFVYDFSACMSVSFSIGSFLVLNPSVEDTHLVKVFFLSVSARERFSVPLSDKDGLEARVVTTGGKIGI